MIKSSFFGEIHIDQLDSVNQSPWKADIQVNDQVVNFKLDSGADVSVLPASVYDNLKPSVKLEPTNKVLLGPCNYKLNCIGKFQAKLTANQKCIHNEIYVVKGLERPLLSRYASQSLNLINKVDAISSEEYKNNIVNQYPDLFKGLGEIEGEYKINLVENSTPFALTTPRKVPLPLLSKTKKEKTECLKWGWLRGLMSQQTGVLPWLWCQSPQEKSGYVLTWPNWMQILRERYTLCHQLTTLWAKLGTLRYSPRLMQIQPFGKESYQKNQNCSPHSLHHGVGFALRDCLMAYSLAQNNFKKLWKKSWKA